MRTAIYAAVVGPGSGSIRRLILKRKTRYDGQNAVVGADRDDREPLGRKVACEGDEAVEEGVPRLSLRDSRRRVKLWPMEAVTRPPRRVGVTPS